MKKLIAGNWKMNKTVKEAVSLAAELKELIQKPKCDVAVCVPFIDIDAVGKALHGSPIALGSQNIAWADKGAFTGEISASMLVTEGVKYAIVGHSERRTLFAETDETVQKRAKQALNNNLIPIICVGELLREREEGRTEEVLNTQISGSLKGFSPKEIEESVIAYEPVWAIGTGLSATNEQADSAIAFIRTVLKRLGANEKKVRILYGGSMNAQNAPALLAMPNIDGGLIGGASLLAADFAAIVAAAK